MSLLLRLLAVYRLTRLVVADYITEDARRALQRRLPVKLAYLLGCPWCASMYVGALVAFAPRNRFTIRLWEALAASAIAGIVSEFVHVEEEAADYLDANDGDDTHPADPE